MLQPGNDISHPHGTLAASFLHGTTYLKGSGTLSGENGYIKAVNICNVQWFKNFVVFVHKSMN